MAKTTQRRFHVGQRARFTPAFLCSISGFAESLPATEGRVIKTREVKSGGRVITTLVTIALGKLDALVVHECNLEPIPPEPLRDTPQHRREYRDYCDHFIENVDVPGAWPMSYADWLQAGDERPVAPY